jgi:DNA (cytosine-5)-methyltransferase 1
MSAPRMLDVYSGESGAGMGYHRAGFLVYSIDNDPARAKLAPVPIYVGDAIEALAILLAGGSLPFTHPDGRIERLSLSDFAALHGSPPCTGYTRGTAAVPDRLTRYDRLIAATRDLFVQTGLPYVIENVADAAPELDHPMLLCWSMFNAPGSVLDDDGTPLRMERHRLFESNVWLESPGACNHPAGIQVAGAYGGARRDKWEAKHVRKGGYVPASLDVLRALLGTPWMSEKGCFLSIPPAYSAWIGRQLLDHLTAESAA